MNGMNQSSIGLSMGAYLPQNLFFTFKDLFVRQILLYLSTQGKGSWGNRVSSVSPPSFFVTFLLDKLFECK